MSAIEASGLTVHKNKQRILNRLDFTVKSGTITGLIGPSGSGKTTLMRSIVGVQRLTSGQLTVLGLPAGSKRLRAKVGYVTQSPSIYGDLTVLQNLRYFAALMKASKGIVDDVITTVQLDAQRDQLVETLSGGQKARVSLAIALLGQPDVLVLDEPTVGLDPLLRQDLWELFAELASGGTTLLISSHVMDEAERCDNLLLLRDGQLLWSDTRQGLLESTHATSVEAAFIQMITAREIA